MRHTSGASSMIDAVCSKLGGVKANRAPALVGVVGGMMGCMLTACGPSGDIRLFPVQAGVESPSDKLRDPLESPYAASSIWNTALGDQAALAPVVLRAASLGIRSEAVVVLLNTGAAALSVEHSDAGWSGADRCPASAPQHFGAHAPADFLVVEGVGRSATPIVAIQDDSRSLKQGLPFVRCTPNAPGTIAFEESASDLYGDGIDGANGGSGLSALGGVLRLDELLPETEPPRHVLAVHVWGQENFWDSTSDEECFRWPASRGDAFCKEDYGGTQPELRMGALLVLPSGSQPPLRTDAAKKLAWTLQNYGAYVVNDAGSSSYAFNVELSPEGWFSEEFRKAWGFSFETSDLASDWALDLQALFDALAVVTDNDLRTTGGAGARLQPALSPLAEP